MFAQSSPRLITSPNARGGWHRPLIASAPLAAGLVIAAVVCWIVLGGASGGSAVRAYTDGAGWSLSYPRGWYMEQSEQELNLAAIEVTVANFPVRSGIAVRKWSSGANVRVLPAVGRSGRFPADGVALRLENQSGVPESNFPDTPLPVSLRSFRPSGLVAGVSYNAGTGETFGDAFGAPRSLVRQVVLERQPWTAVVWIGPRATPASIRRLRRLLDSLSS